MVNDKNIESNIGKYYLATALGSFGFYTPIIQLFYLASSLSVFEIAILGVIWTITKMIVEVPSSILADKWGRKKVLLLSSAFGILQLVTLIYSREFTYFALASVWSAASVAFLSGTDVAFFYDTLKALKREGDFDKLWAKQQIYNQGPFIIAFATSGLWYKMSFVLPFQLSLIFLGLSFVTLLTLTEPEFSKPVDDNMKFLNYFGKSAKLILENRQLRAMLLFTLLFSLGSDISYGYGQIYLKQLAFPVALFGAVFVLKSFLVTISANTTSSLRKKMSLANLFGFEILAMTLLFYVMWATNNSIVGAGCFILIAIPYGIFGITKSSYMHQRIESHQRATVDSMFSFFIALLFLVIEPVFGFLTDTFSIKLPFLLIAIILTFYSAYYFGWGRKNI